MVSSKFVAGVFACVAFAGVDAGPCGPISSSAKISSTELWPATTTTVATTETGASVTTDVQTETTTTTLSTGTTTADTETPTTAPELVKVGELLVDTFDECIAACDRTPGCIAITYLEGTGMCTLSGSPFTNPNEILGLTFDECVAACDNRPGCIAVNYLEGEQKCTVLFTVTNPPEPETNPDESFGLTFAECTIKCDNTPGCIAVNYLEGEQKCTVLFTVTNPPEPETNPNELSGVTYTQCLTACDATAGCVAVNYTPDTQICTLLSTTTTPVPEINPNEVSGVTYAQCLTACDAKAGCVAVNYTPDTQKSDQESDEINGELVVKGLEEFSPRHKLSNANIAEPEPPSPERYVFFDAISYVWGQTTFTDTFVTPQGSIPITASLASILRRLRDKEKEQLYWADGLCINQSDMAEKEVQVALMGIIYSSARKVFCDIGEDTEDTALLLDAMQRYWKRNIRHGFRVGQGSSLVLSGPSTAKIMDIPYPTDEEADAIEEVKGDEWPKRLFKFFSAPWFHRLWIVQEFVLGHDVVMVIGRRFIKWGEIWAGFVGYKGVGPPWMSDEYTQEELTGVLMSYNLMCLVRSSRRIDLNTAHGLEFYKIINIVLCGVEMNQADLPICMLLFCTHGCTNPRDRYFGILGMVNDEDKEKTRSLRPDYKSPLRDITMRYWKYALQTKFGGELMLSAGLPGRTEEYPSWIRDFSVPKPLSQIWIGNSLTTAWHTAGGPTSTWSATFSNHDPNLLFVEGWYMDDVTEKSIPSIANRSGFAWMAQWIDEAFSFYQARSKSLDNDLDRRYPLTGEPVHEAALKVVMDYNQADTMAPDDNLFRAMLRIGLSVPSLVSTERAKGDDFEKQL
ncbi:hypothetical protein ACHAPO_011075, partial [Fusarium lateritium]